MTFKIVIRVPIRHQTAYRHAVKYYHIICNNVIQVHRPKVLKQHENNHLINYE